MDLPASSRERAVATARAAATERGHLWRDDHVKVVRTWRGYVVYGNKGWRGGQIRVKVSGDGHFVLGYWRTPK